MKYKELSLEKLTEVDGGSSSDAANIFFILGSLLENRDKISLTNSKLISNVNFLSSFLSYFSR